MYRAAARYFPPRVARQACGGRRSYAYQRSRLVGATPEPSVSAEKVRHEDQLVSGHLGCTERLGRAAGRVRDGTGGVEQPDGRPDADGEGNTECEGVVTWRTAREPPLSPPAPCGPATRSARRMLPLISSSRATPAGASRCGGQRHDQLHR
jgi:hypothetical protein